MNAASTDAPANPPTGAPRRPHRLRRITLWGLGVLLVLVLVAVGGISWYYSDQVLSTDRTLSYDAVATMEGTDRVQIMSPDSKYIGLPGRYGLAWADGYAEVGPVLDKPSGGVVRSYTAGRGELGAQTPVYVDQTTFDGDPKSARGLDFQDVSITGDVGAMPAWYVPAAQGATAGVGTWAIFVHGRGARRTEGLRILPALHAAGLSTLVISYRNDGEAPASSDHKDHLGDTEWRDVQAAAQWAVEHGAQKLVLVGYSFGGAISLQAASRSAQRDKIVALVLDSPVIDWRTVFYSQGDDRGLPRPLTGAALWTVQQRIGIDFNKFDWVARSRELTRPMLIFATPGDSYVPYGPAKQLAATRPDLITFQESPDAEHTRSWNVEPEGYEQTVTAWLTGALAH